MTTTFAAIATVPERSAMVKRVMESLFLQIDAVSRYANTAWGELPGDCGKFHFLRSADCEWYFTCDDDIIYPPDYADRMIRLSVANDDAVVTCHGRTFYGTEHLSYYGADTIRYHCLGTVLEVQPVDVPGSGVTMIPRKWMKPIAKALRTPKVPNAADLYLALALKKLGTQALVLPHDAGWLKVVKGNYRTIYDEVKGRDERAQIGLMEEYLR